jgi:hypothetical protein
MRTYLALVLATVTLAVGARAAAAADGCFAVVHGWDWQREITSEATAQAAWESSAQGQLAAHQASFAAADIEVRYVHYDGRDPYWWDSAPGVAQQLVDIGGTAACAGKPLTVVCYSMGCTVVDEILAQAHPSDPYHDPRYATATARVLEVWSVNGVHGGAELANTYEFVNDVLLGFVNAVWNPGNALRGLTTGNSPRAWGYTKVGKPVFAIGGYDGWWYTDPPGEDDGVLAYHSQYGIRKIGSYYGDWRGHVPNDHWAANGLFYNAWQADKDHYEGKGGSGHKIKKLKTSPITGYCNCENDTWFSSHTNPRLVRQFGF